MAMYGMIPSGAYVETKRPQTEEKKPSGFNKPGGWAEKLGGIGGILLANAGNRAGPALLNRYYDQQDSRKKAEAERYQPQKVGDSIVRLNPQTGQYETVYSAPKTETPSALERNYDFIKKTRPELAGSYLEGQANPMQWQRIENPDGSVQMFPMPRNAGVPGLQGAPTLPQEKFMGMGGFESMYQSMGPQGFSQWQQQHGVGVKVESKEEYDRLPPGTRYIAPDGSQRVKN